MTESHAEMRPLTAALENAVSRATTEPKELAIAFSGGLDSSLLTMLAARHRQGCGQRPPRLYVTGLEGSQDLQAARSGRAVLETVLDQELELEVLTVTSGEARTALARLLELIGPDPLALAYLLPLHLVAQQAREPALLSGQGADELFGGYARYGRMRAEKLARAMDGDLERLLEGGLERDRLVAAAAGHELLTPYLDTDLLQQARRFEALTRYRGPGPDPVGPGKGLLRVLARELGLPEKLWGRAKKAAQYGSGLHKVVRTHFDALHTAELELDLGSPEAARSVAQAIAPENLPYVALARQGQKLLLKAAADSLGSLEQSIDDVLACIDTATRLAGRFAPGPDPGTEVRNST